MKKGFFSNYDPKLSLALNNGEAAGGLKISVDDWLPQESDWTNDQKTLFLRL